MNVREISDEEQAYPDQTSDQHCSFGNDLRHRARKHEAQGQKSGASESKEQHQRMGEEIVAERTPVTQGSEDESARSHQGVPPAHGARAALKRRPHIFTPLSAKYLTAPGCQGTGELALVWYR